VDEAAVSVERIGNWRGVFSTGKIAYATNTWFTPGFWAN
jgi:hypothetical protein